LGGFVGAKPESAKTGQFERALRELRARILSGDFQADSHISETAAARMMGISRTPLRAAMAHLVDEGLLDRAPSGRCTVRPFSQDDIADAIEFRGVMEGTVLRLAAERGAVPEHLAQCRRIIDQIDLALGDDAAAIDFDRYTELNAAFHQHLARLSGSATMERELDRAYRLPLASPNAFLQNQADVPAVRQSLYRAQAQHKTMIEAVENREGSRAEASAREHARLARANFNYVLFKDRGLAHRIPGLALVTNNENETTSHKGRTP
jgi:GntR family transcriptional regulator of vanillate catabolism